MAALTAAALTAGVWSAAGATTPPDDTAAGSAAPAATAVAPDFEVDPDASVAVGIVLAPANLDIIVQSGAALEQLLLDNVYETLLTATPEGEVGPGLASVEVSDDGLTYTLTLAEGVTFHSGEALTSADVVYSLEQTKETGNAADALADVETITAVDDLTVELGLSARNDDLAWSLSRRAGAVVQDGSTPEDRQATANGTGPFALTDFAEGQSITLTRNDAYWGDVPQVAEIVFQFFGADQNAMVNALNDGDIQIAVAVNTELVPQFEDNPDFVVSSGTTNGEFTLGFNNQGDELSDPLVRQAITQAIDKDAILELFNGYGTVIGGPVPPTDAWFEDLTDVYPYDPEAAREKLAEAGYADGLELTYVVPNHYPTSISDYVVAQLGDVGITVDLQSVEFSAWLEQVYQNHDYDLTAVLHVEPRDIYNYANPEYYWLYDNPEVQDLLEQALRAETPEESIELRQEAVRLIVEDAPAVWLILYDDVLVASSEVAGYPTFDVNSRFDAAGIVAAG